MQFKTKNWPKQSPVITNSKRLTTIRQQKSPSYLWLPTYYRAQYYQYVKYLYAGKTTYSCVYVARKSKKCCDFVFILISHLFQIFVWVLSESYISLFVNWLRYYPTDGITINVNDDVGHMVTSAFWVCEWWWSIVITHLWSVREIGQLCSIYGRVAVRGCGRGGVDSSGRRYGVVVSRYSKTKSMYWMKAVARWLSSRGLRQISDGVQYTWKVKMQCEIRGMGDMAEAAQANADTLPKPGRVNEG
jgi:hypothetical protein